MKSLSICSLLLVTALIITGSQARRVNQRFNDDVELEEMEMFPEEMGDDFVQLQGPPTEPPVRAHIDQLHRTTVPPHPPAPTTVPHPPAVPPLPPAPLPSPPAPLPHQASVSKAKSQQTTCSCTNVTISLTESLESCTDALSSYVNCGNGTGSGSGGSGGSGSSCADIKRNNPNSESGNYDITVSDRIINVYCNMDTLCGSDDGWTRLGFLDMTNSATICPLGFDELTVDGVRLCALRASGCISVQLPSNGIQYTQVCGRVRGYQRQTTDGFHNRDINSVYVDGVTITRGSPRTHVWSLGSGFREDFTDGNNCPCNAGSTGGLPPSFVGNDYYCESGTSTGPASRFFTEDPLWDKTLCRSREEPCCSSSLLPWFHKNITSFTTEFLELRVCVDQGLGDENMAVDQYELYVM